MELKNLQHALMLPAVFAYLKERDGLTFNLSAVRVLLAIKMNPLSQLSSINTIGKRLGVVNNRRQITTNVRKLIECGLVHVEVAGKTNLYGLTISGFNLLTDIDKRVRRSKVRKLKK